MCHSRVALRPGFRFPFRSIIKKAGFAGTALSGRRKAGNLAARLRLAQDLPDSRIVIGPLSMASASMLRRLYFVGKKQPET